MIGEGLSMQGEVLNVMLKAPTANVARVQGGASIEMSDSGGSSSAMVYDGQTPTITFIDNQDGTYTLQSILGQDTQRVVVHDGEPGVQGESVNVSINDSVQGQHTLTFTVGENINSTTVKDGLTEEWVANKSYSAGQMVIYGTNIYKCLIANADSRFNSEKWTLLGLYPVFSSNEVVIGTWVNGKTLYQKTYTATTPSTSNTFVKLFDLDATIGNIVNIETTSNNIIVGISDINSIVEIDPVKVVAFDGSVYCKTYGSQQENIRIYITIKYTKNS